MSVRGLLRNAAPLVLAVLITACGGSRSFGVMPHTNAMMPLGTSATFKLLVPSRATSAATQSVSITVNGSATAQTVPTSGPSCTMPSTASPATCTVALTAPVGNDTFTVTIHGSKTTFAATIVQGQANVITASLGGVPSFVTVTPLPTSTYLVGAAGGGFTAYGDQPLGVAVVSYDADANPIVGASSPTLSLTGTSGLAVTPPAADAPRNVYTIKNAAFDTHETLTATATPASGATAITQSVAVTTRHVAVYTANRNVNKVYVHYDESVTPAYALTVPGNAAASGLAVDASGTVYVPIASGGVAVYQNGATSPSYTITAGIGSANNACVDHEGDLYVTDDGGNGGSGEIEVFRPGATSPSATITDRMDGPFACALNPIDDSLWVVMIKNSTVAHYLHGAVFASTSFALTGGTANTGESIAVDRSGTLYVGLNSAGNTPFVQVYLAGSQSANYTFTTWNADAFDGPTGLAVDVAGNLWVGSFCTGVCGAVQRYGPTNPTAAPASALTHPYTGLDSIIGLAVTPHG